MANKKVSIGIDIGSISINIVALAEDGSIVAKRPYKRHFGRFLEYLPSEYAAIVEEVGKENIDSVALTGTHGFTVATVLDLPHEIETTAAILGMSHVAPDVRTLIAIGGFDSAFFTLDTGANGKPIISNFKLNEACAAGTGSFIDQQAERIFSDDSDFHNIEDPQEKTDAILNKFIELGMTSDDPASVACRCTVFTKSDMIHLQNRGVMVKHIISGLHHGVARNFKSTLITTLPIEEKIYMIGGYSKNKLAVKAFRELLNKEISVPDCAAEVGAIGAVLKAREKNLGRFVEVSEFENLANREDLKAPRTHKLEFIKSTFTPNIRWVAPEIKPKGIKAYLGFDIGSTTSKIVLIDEKGELLYKRYIATEGQPVNAIKKGMKHLIESLGTDYEICGVGSTGSGREVAALFVGADDVVNEITAHAMGTADQRPDVDTIFELGGQDAKYTALKDGFVVDFRMNKVCAAGTGSFLEETANKMDIAIDEEYEKLAMASKLPLSLAERCTVFMESDLMSYLQQGAPVEDLLAGLSYAVVHNYLNRVVGEGKIGNVISFQGGPSLNKSVVAAFEKISGKEIITLKNREVIGAVGAALHAKQEIARIREQKPDYKTRFYGFGIIDQAFIHEEEICERNDKCHNKCKLQIYRVGDNEAIYGGDCGMYETVALPVKKGPNFHAIRQNLWFRAMKGKYMVLDDTFDPKMVPAGRKTIGIPRTMHFHQLGLFWVHLFYEMGYMPIISADTNEKIVSDGISAMTCETCFPIKLSHGHTLALKDKVDYLFIPELIEMPPSENDRRGYYCPYQQGNYHMLKAAIGLEEATCIHPDIHLQTGKKGMSKSFKDEFKRLKLHMKGFDRAWDSARAVLTTFQKELKRIGQAALDKLGPDGKAVVVISRPYALYDTRTNLNLFNTFSKLGATAIPFEFLDIRDVSICEDYNNLYWGFGEKIMKGARFISQDKRLFGLYLTSFSCGPDSFILHFFAQEMNRFNRPYLELELDEHSAGAGVETRLLAFLDVLNNYNGVVKDSRIEMPNVITGATGVKPLRERTVYLPYMSEGAHMLGAAFRGIGINAEVTPTYTPAGLDFGKRNTSGKECFPCTVTTGDMFDQIHTLENKGVDVNDELAFFMPEADGPCRFGQYSRLHRILLDEYGYEGIPILSPTCEDAYRFSGLLTKKEANDFRKQAWHGIVYSDLIEKALWRIRPYEKEKGITDKTFNLWMQKGGEALEKHGIPGLIEAAHKAAVAFENIAITNEKKPCVGIVGEIYVRSHKESNQDLVRKLENLGMETMTASIAEWVEYTTWGSIHEAKKNFNWKKASHWKEIGELYVADWWQKRTYAKILAPFARLLAGREDHSVKSIMNEAKGLLTRELSGEAILSLGGAIAYIDHNKFDGVINAMPFTCMPSTIASAILKGQMRGKAPYIDMIYDGTVIPNRETNLSTFSHQVQQTFSLKQN
jgi:predicted CoA-substrate-specific enzyme activase